MRTLSLHFILRELDRGVCCIPLSLGEEAVLSLETSMISTIPAVASSMWQYVEQLWRNSRTPISSTAKTMIYSQRPICRVNRTDLDMPLEHKNVQVIMSYEVFIDLFAQMLKHAIRLCVIRS